MDNTSVWIEVTDATTKEKIFINYEKVIAIGEFTREDGTKCASIFVNGNSFVVNESYVELRSQIEQIIRGY